MRPRTYVLRPKTAFDSASGSGTRGLFGPLSPSGHGQPPFGLLELASGRRLGERLEDPIERAFPAPHTGGIG